MTNSHDRNSQPPRWTRRAALMGLIALPVGLRAVAPVDLDRRWREIEAASGGRLGVAMLDTGSGKRSAYRADERFPMCSTFKPLAVAAVLARVDRGVEKLDRRIPFGKADLLDYAPVTTARVGEGGMTLADLCEAAITVSDNTAANLILATYGGPAGLTEYLRSIGDPTTRLDRFELELNEARPGDPRDTTTPAAMVSTMQVLLLGDALSTASRERLIGWLVANKTGNERLRAGLPAGWRAGDKTGTGYRGTTNDVAIVWPPNRAPLLIAAYLTETEATSEARNATIASVGRVVAGL